MYKLFRFLISQILLVLFVCSFQVFGQDNFPQVRSKLDRIFGALDLSAANIPYFCTTGFSL
jgi:hypothetical protein